MEIIPVAHFHSPFTTKFGIPRQSGLVEGLRGRIVFEPEYRSADALRGLEGFDYLWMIWGFSANIGARKAATVRPPRLGGNVRMGVFATRSPFRPNNLGLSSVRIESIEHTEASGPVVHVSGADLMDGTPIYDIKPYVAQADCHEGVRCGFADSEEWHTLRVDIPDDVRRVLPPEQWRTLAGVLELDPRPHFHDDPSRVYGMSFGGSDIRFRVDGAVLTVVEVVPGSQT
ncbi:tRNA (N6-threonylcarbamoyladenosine(37)-N6)-methyltransferase TrmO [Xylanibacter rodentium]|uniref:tRNA (N6-threonylcarbamoyladenosine(37)-N6)-methyltransferase TrmO n=1 Tax=Xylanibacter rodentium TaxID=2736289 RepID=A0ABX2AVP4_9BACT|nr:tRNA (N6-threonylcarbamoyladenosine(37)-N6)-methyltransferase TrmO [Xylanibacter rodentium]NPE11261.1 tRNA (N6-threonylcarbamoyladenosine(37)-N6)-methyltransferase TrmO [Prevotella sp. PJ1A]NPE13528.1 tRNA (N6-threonylcarbamoyladenosine(37)-N6)-methyltransferase TrmO [Xylanibacter rodentium]NPE38254.1 tRNA (N6-threonylcarbamoyladenosine(37)-N6)-methyltransferase TrmO [Prevotella sp. PCJ2]